MGKLAAQLSVVAITLGALAACNDSASTADRSQGDGTGESQAAGAAGAGASAAELSSHDPVARTALRLIEQGRRVFRHDTFGDEAFWGGALGLHQAPLGPLALTASEKADLIEFLKSL